ncbi:probable salivary secreted peptide [Anastrepha ludens]|uniref:probable salivary secreted peptide n=1 Tax=Anastrepha ludens TaxID=28586 RepID=UPI0023B2029D|nr:probable salivary secreted peptide [Anastrepha ludens]
MKLLYVFTFITLCALARAADSPASHNLEMGARMPGDRHLTREVIYSKSAVLQKKTGDYTYEQKNVPKPATITYLKVQDQYTNGKGGYATLTSGGPGFSYVNIHFTSKRWRGYNFIIDIYGI